MRKKRVMEILIRLSSIKSKENKIITVFMFFYFDSYVFMNATMITRAITDFVRFSC
jgi:hypothetical protein